MKTNAAVDAHQHRISHTLSRMCVYPLRIVFLTPPLHNKMKYVLNIKQHRMNITFIFNAFPKNRRHNIDYKQQQQHTGLQLNNNMM